MTVREQRKRPRKKEQREDSAVVEIKHTFGPIKKSIHKVLEFDEHGMSFLVPASEGYFRPGVPLEYRFVRGDVTRVESQGAVRYYHPYNDYNGNAYFRIGVEHKRLNGKELPAKFKIRPERYRLAGIQRSQHICFSVESKNLVLPLEDISRYSAAFYCDEEDALVLRVSSVIDEVVITFGERTIFEGTVIVTRRVLEGSQYRIVIEPRSSIFNIDVIEEQENLTGVAQAVDGLLLETQKNKSIDKDFKVLIADMRLFLEEYRRILETPLAVKLEKESGSSVFLDELNKTFYPQWDEYCADLERIVNSLDLSEKDKGLYKKYFQRHLHPLIMSAPFCHRVYFKPLGYPGDYEMMRMIKEESYDGPTLFSKLVNRHALENPLAAANRNRVKVLAERIANFVEQRGSEEVRLLSIASGPSLEIQKLVEDRPEIADRIHITLLDQEDKALKYAQESLYSRRIVHGSRIRVELIHQSIGSFLKQREFDKSKNPFYDMIYIFGLFDYFDDDTCKFCINYCANFVKENGKILISNYSLEGHHHRTYLEYAGEWYMIYRNKEQMAQLARSVSRPCTFTVQQDPTQVIKFLEIQFGEEH